MDAATPDAEVDAIDGNKAGERSREPVGLQDVIVSHGRRLPSCAPGRLGASLSICALGACLGSLRGEARRIGSFRTFHFREDLPRPTQCGIGPEEHLGVAVVRIIEHQILPFERPMVKSEEHTSELQSLMRISYAVFCLKKKKEDTN